MPISTFKADSDDMSWLWWTQPLPGKDLRLWGAKPSRLLIYPLGIHAASWGTPDLHDVTDICCIRSHCISLTRAIATEADFENLL